MLPLKAPLPTAWYLPFQPDAGIQTSILMSESLEGFSVTATRQNGCSFAAAFPPWAAPLPGCVNPPAATDWASVMVAFGSVRDESASHDPAALAGTVRDCVRRN